MNSKKTEPIQFDDIHLIEPSDLALYSFVFFC